MKEDGSMESGLIQRFREGDEEAFCHLFGKCQATLRARILRLMPKPLLRRLSIADVLQEARIIAFQRRVDFEDRGPGSFGRWLLGIVDMKIRHHVERHAEAGKRSVDCEITRGCRPDTVQYVGKEPSPSQAAIGSELEEIAERAMMTLSEDYKEVLRLTCLESLGTEEAAKRMGRTKEAIRKLQGRALLKWTEVFDRMRGADHA